MVEVTSTVKDLDLVYMQVMFSIELLV